MPNSPLPTENARRFPADPIPLWICVLGSFLLLAVGVHEHPIRFDFLQWASPPYSGVTWPERFRMGAAFLRAFLAAGGVLFLALTWGARTRRWLGLAAPNAALAFAMNFALGASSLSLLALGLGLAGLWDARLFAACVILGVLEGVLAARKGDPFFLPSGFRLPSFGTWETSLLAVLGLGALASAFLQSLLPDVNYDTLVYHLAVLDSWRFAHSVVDLPFNLYSHFPFGAECFFAWGYLTAGPTAANLLNAFTALAFCLGSAGWAAEKSGPTAGFLAFGFTATFPILTLSSWSIHAEPFLALDLLFFLYTLAKGSEDGGRRWIPIAGLFAGAAMGTKYLALPWVLCGLAVWAWSRPTIRRADAARAVALALIFSFPWYLKNLIYSGAPFYPFFSHALPPWGMTAFEGDAQTLFRYGWMGRWDWLPNFLFSRPNGIPTVAALALWAILSPTVEPMRKDTRFLGRASALMLATGVLLTGEQHLLLPVFLLFMTWAALRLGKAHSTQAPRAAAWVALAGFALSFPSLAALSVRYYQNAGVLLGRETPRAYRERMPQSSYLKAGWKWRTLLPPGSRVMRVGDARTAYLQFPTTASSAFNDPPLARCARDSRDAGDLALRLRRLGVTHLWIDMEEGTRLYTQMPSAWSMSPEALARLNGFLGGWTRLRALDGPDALLTVVSPETPGKGPAALPWPVIPENPDPKASP